ncbi:MAG: hypothetical protein GTO63_27645 [Anaerolineae bacterium]|nr:hypothetical protein [Anaerolineae bacterium]NIN98505.1 hypothetical protein [Anaerolineae bacterium]
MADTITLRDGTTLDVEGDITPREWMRWLDAERGGDFHHIASTMAGYVKKWSLDGKDPADPNSYLDMDMRIFNEMSVAVAGYLLTGAPGKA